MNTLARLSPRLVKSKFVGIPQQPLATRVYSTEAEASKKRVGAVRGG